jgi:hypothetical protein
MKALNFLKHFIVILLQILGGLMMFLAVIVFAIATAIDSPANFKFRWKVFIATCKKIIEADKLKRLETKLKEKQYEKV